MMMKSISFTVIFATVGLIIATIIEAAPSDLKVNDLDTNEIPLNKKLYKKGVNVNWGGYQASAGLGGDTSGGGLFASAGTPNGQNANAGLFGGSGLSSSVDTRASASADTPVFYTSQSGANPNGQAPFFDKVFSIPINVLHSVNDYLKTKGSGVRAVNSGEVRPDVRFNSADENSQGTAGGASIASASASSGTDYSVASNSGQTQAAHGHHKQPDYDKIFNIPITALKSVNDLLGGR